jgi:nitrite reductase/ring-hydroxylating ferredoxin subunit
MTDESQQDQFATRRCVLLGAGVLGAAGLLTACSTAAVPYDANDAGQAPAAAGPPTTALDTASAAGSGGTDSGATNSGAADVPVGGGKVYQTAQVVVTQPAKGQYKAFSCVCTHVGCLCNQVANGTIDCPCHGAKFKITDGSVVTGPATTPLAAASITVTDGKIFLN